MSECFEVLSLDDILCVYLAERKADIRDVKYFVDPVKGVVIIQFKKAEERTCQKKEEGVILKGFDINGYRGTLKKIDKENYQVRIERIGFLQDPPRLESFSSITLATSAYNKAMRDSININTDITKQPGRRMELSKEDIKSIVRGGM